jgi:hypothetical protein
MPGWVLIKSRHDERSAWCQIKASNRAAGFFRPVRAATAALRVTSDKLYRGNLTPRLRAAWKGLPMRHLKVSAVLAVALFASMESVLAQTGEFAATVPGSVVHSGYALQDWWQELRNGRPEARPSIEAAQDPVIIVPPLREPRPVKPKKTAKKITTTSQIQPKQQQQ